MRLVCFDLDGTIVDDTEYIWYSLHKHFGVDMKLVREWHRLYSEGKITYEQWFAEDIKWWNDHGAKKEGFMDCVKGLRLMDGAVETIKALKERSVKIAIISGSLNIVVDHFFPTHPFDYVYVNDIYFGPDGRINGFKVTPYDFVHKATAMREIAAKEKIPLEKCAFVGDNVNDIDAVKLAGLGISFNSKSEELDSVADVVIKKKDLREILSHVL
jgi:phosphoserine phosphatase